VTVKPPVWTDAQMEQLRSDAIEIFQRIRMEEPLDRYLDEYEDVRQTIETLFEITTDLRELLPTAVDTITDIKLLEVVRYLSGPPISSDDLKTLAVASLAPGPLRRDAVMAARVVNTVLLGLDRARFPWVSEEREPTATEREAAVVATGAMLSYRRTLTARQNEGKQEQEDAVSNFLENECGFTKVSPREVKTHGDAPKKGQFCREASFGSRKADLIVTLWDGRIMPIECKVSNSSTNSIKRLNNDAAVKARIWLGEFGSALVVPAATLSGVFKLKNLKTAQDDGLTIWWAHDLNSMKTFIEATRP
jgi:hypothetical protein